MADLRGAQGTRAPRGPKFFQFHAVFGKIWQNRMLAPPRGVGAPSSGNPGSATDLRYFITARKEVEQGNIFRSVCQELCPQGACLDIHSRVDTPGSSHPLPREQCMLGDTGNKRAVRILLECILVFTINLGRS